MKKRWPFLLMGILVVAGLVIMRAEWRSPLWPSGKKSQTATVCSNEELPTSESVVHDGEAPVSQPPTGEATPDAAGANAADLYEQAYALFEQLTPDEKALLQGKREADPATAAALYEKIQPILALLRSATGAVYCEWDLGPINKNTPLPHLQKIVDLGNVAGWAADYMFSKDPDAAIGILRDRAYLGNSVGNQGLIGLLVNKSLESQMNNLLRRNFARLTPGGGAKVEALFNEVGVEKDFEDAFQIEAQFFRSSLAYEIAESGIQTVSKTYGAPERIEQILNHLEKFSKTMVASDAQFAQWAKEMQSFIVGLPKDAPFSQLVGAVEKSRVSFQKHLVEKRMLEASLALAQNSPDRLGTFLEPGTQQPFIYRRTPDGSFEFESRTAFNGQPVVLKF